MLAMLCGARGAAPAVQLCLGLLLAPRLGEATKGLPQISLRQTSTNDRIFVDPSGRQRVFHGVNAVVKGPPWLPSRNGFDFQTSLVREDFELMQAAGLNSMRLGLMWPGAEPQRGQYDESYYARTLEIINEAAEYGIYTFVDMHQDALSERFCGEGLPSWAVKEEGTLFGFPQPFMTPFQSGPDGFPTRQDCGRLISMLGKQSGYATPSFGQAAENLYTNKDGLADSWGLFLARFANMTRGLGSVLGINLINEPWTGQAWHNPFRLLPAVANKLLQGAYDVVAGHIRKVNSDVLLMFPGVTWSDLFGLGFHNGFSHPPGGAEFADRSVYSVHFYTPPQRHGGAHDYFDKFALRNARRLQTGLYLTETWGAGSTSEPWEEAVPVAEALGVSWSYWEWKDFCKESPETLNGTSQHAAFGSCTTGYGGQLFNSSGIRPERHRRLGRMYAYAVQGLLTQHHYDQASLTLDFTYDLNPAIRGPTEVYANRRWHGGPEGDFEVTLSPSGIASVKVLPAGGESVSIHILAQAQAAAGSVAVSISPRGGTGAGWEVLV